MRNTLDRALQLIMTVSLLVSILVSSGAIMTAQASGPTYTTHAVVRIDNNAQLATVASSGSGTSSDPYIIENLAINATDHGAGIYIGNTTDHVIIRNCSIYSASFSNDRYSIGSVSVYHASNCIIDHVAVSGYTYYSFYLEYSSRITISNSSCGAHNSAAIWLYYSDNNIVSNNTCSDTDGDSISLLGSYGNVISNNICNWNKDWGISITGGSNNAISNNTCNGNKIGINLDANKNIISANICNSNYYYGISLFCSNRNIVSNNTCNDNSDCGIYASVSSSNTVSNNDCYGDTKYGIRLTSSSNGNCLFGNVLFNDNGATTLYSSSYIQSYDDCTNYWNLSSKGNYWGDWTAPDINSDGVVDEPYTLDGGSNQDHYPLTAASLSYLSISSQPWKAYTNASSIDVSGVAIDSDEISTITWYNDGNSASGACSGTSAWKACVPLVVGTNTITITMVDDFGHEVEDSAVVIMNDTTAPTVVISPTGEGVAINAKIVIEFSEAMNLTSVTIVVSNSVEGNITFDGNVTIFVPNELKYNGNYTVTVSGKDLAGNTVMKKWTFSTIVKVGNVTGHTVDMDGNALANVTVTLSNGMMTESDANGAFEFKGVGIGSYSASIAKDGYVGAALNATVTENVTHDLGVIALVSSESQQSTGSDCTLLIVASVAAIIVVALAASLVLIHRRNKQA